MQRILLRVNVTLMAAVLSAKLLNQNKGQAEMVKAFVETLRSGAAAPISFAEIYASTLSTFKILESIRTGSAVAVD